MNPGRAAGYNLLIITIDTVRADRLGCYGYVRAETPNIDRLTDHGVQFLQAIAPAPLTLPSHSTVMTGLDVPSHGARDNGSFHLADDKRTLAEVLAEHGYATAAFVGAYVLDARYGLDQGFDTYDDEVNPTGAAGAIGTFQRAPRGCRHGRGDRVVRRTRRGDTAAAVLRVGALLRRPRAVRAPVRVREASRTPYDGEIAFVDAQIGRLLTHCARGARRPTLVILASDHGEGLGEHGEETHSRLIYDSTMHVPLILSCPSLFERRVTVHDRVVSLADIFPTALDLLGIAWDPPIDGVNLLTTPADAERAIYIETMAPLVNNGWASLHGLRRLDDKYILAPRPEYYDLVRDPGEHPTFMATPLPSPAARRALDERLGKWDRPERALAQAAPLDPEQLRRLAALGYVQAENVGPNVGQLDPKDMLPLWQDMMRAQSRATTGTTNGRRPK